MSMLEWIKAHETAFWWMAVISIVTCVVGLIIAPWWAINLPADYFLRPAARRRPPKSPEAKRWARVLMRNLIGGLFILAGLSMLVLPGQGILAILAGGGGGGGRAGRRGARAGGRRPAGRH